jgi:flagellar hook-length control protein FliK
MMLAHSAADAAPQAASAEVRTPVGASGWSDEIGTHLAIMAANGRETASLRLSPEHLGPLEIQISVKDGQTNVVFGASNADTRSALEQSLPRLREMFAAHGLVLGDANVSRDAPRDPFRPGTFGNSTRGSADASAGRDVKPITLTRLGLVDTYV